MGNGLIVLCRNMNIKFGKQIKGIVNSPFNGIFNGDNAEMKFFSFNIVENIKKTGPVPQTPRSD